jgi:hypothetical protein
MLGGPQGRSGQVRKISPTPGVDPWTVLSVASCYTDYATRPTFFALIQYARLPSGLVRNKGYPLYPATENGILQRGPAAVLNDKKQMAVRKMWHYISTSTIVLFEMVT